MAFFSQWLTTDNITLAIGAVIILYWVAVTLILIWEDREPYDTLAWILVLALFPVFGLILYFFAGKNWPAITMKRRWFLEMLSIRRPYMDVIYKRYQSLAEELLNPEDRGVEDKVVSTIRAENEAGPLPARTFKVYPSGEEYFPILIQDIYNARRFIHMQYFIWERDELTTKITDALMDRVKAGVEVRILNDFIGNIQYKKDDLKALVEAGAEWYSDVSEVAKINYRNHRKITVIDGEIGHSGGFNVGQEYIDGKPKYPTWRDTGIRFEGAAVAAMQRLFAERWLEVREENLFQDKYFPDPSLDPGRIMTQVTSQGVEDYWHSATRSFQVAMLGAKKCLRIQSPYFVPDQSTYDTMINAALAGTEVHFMMTGWPDKKLAFRAAQSYWKPLITAGGRIYLYEKGFFHAKSMVVDDEICAIGTMNMDIRSLRLHKELMVWCYDHEVAKRCVQIYEDDLKECREVTLEEIESWTQWKHFSNSFSRLTSNLI